MTRRVLAGLCVLLLAGDLGAQESVRPGGWSALRVSKWATLTVTAAAALYGVAAVSSADDSYEALEEACAAAPDVCRLRRPDGAYADAALEAQYRSVVRQDRRARNALLASQVGVVATVAMFILDLRHARSPADIPYEPRGLELAARPDGGVELRLSLPTR